MMNDRSAFVSTLGSVPIVRRVLRWYARRYAEGSAIRIPSGYAAGMKWKRHHRYVSGYWTGVYEMPIQRALSRELKEGDTFYDVGANAGFFSILAARLVGLKGRVFAFEPLPENIESVQEQFSINSLGQCALIPKAVGGQSGTALLLLAENSSMARIAGDQETRAEKSLTVPTITLDEFVQADAPPDLIKIDVEGFETEVLLGAERLINSPNAPRLLIELHSDEQARNVESILTACGYVLNDLSGRRLEKGALGQTHILAYPPAAVNSKGITRS